MDFLKRLREANTARDKEWNPKKLLSLSFRGNELDGEVGEALDRALELIQLAIAGGRTANILKKLDREQLGLVGSRATLEQLAEELADTIICVDLIAMDVDIDLMKAIIRKFNKTSDERGLKVKL